MTRSSHDRFYLNKAEGKLFGVCAGLGDYLDVDALWIRVGLVTLTLLGFGATIPLYLATAFFASRRPAAIDDRYDPYEEERQMRRRPAGGRSTQLRADLGDMDRQLTEMERHFGRDSLSVEPDRPR